MDETPRKWHQLTRAEQAAMSDRLHMQDRLAAQEPGPGHRNFRNDFAAPPANEASYGRAATRRRNQAAARAAKRGNP